jgi:hypothetical protein
MTNFPPPVPEDVPQPVPEEPWYRNWWTGANRPYRGCACVYLLVAAVVLWVLLALAFPGLGLR